MSCITLSTGEFTHRASTAFLLKSNVEGARVWSPSEETCFRESGGFVSQGFTEVTARLSVEEKEDLNRRLQEISLESSPFIDFFNEGRLEEILKLADYPLIGLEALKRGMISKEDFATIVLPYASLDSNKQCIKLFNKDGSINKRAKDLIAQTLWTTYGPLLQEEELLEFFASVRTKPLIQQQFFLEERDPIAQYGIRSIIFNRYEKLNVFSFCHEDEKSYFMIPSAAMMQCFLDIKFKQQAVNINFVLGLSSDEDIEINGKTNQRDCALRFPGIDLVDEADGHPALGTCFTYHDFFHAFLVSCIPSSHQGYFLQMLENIKKAHIDPELKNILRSAFIDRDSKFYFLPTIQGNQIDLEAFFKHVLMFFMSVENRCKQKQKKMDDSLSCIFTDLFSLEEKRAYLLFLEKEIAANTSEKIKSGLLLTRIQKKKETIEKEISYTKSVITHIPRDVIEFRIKIRTELNYEEQFWELEKKLGQIHKNSAIYELKQKTLELLLACLKKGELLQGKKRKRVDEIRV